ncbi:hypothetical protein [Micromonospora sp. NBC_00421]|uniref:hypothetical protein n=1 Tax=Micromonospora sp. NBC_00421 TaxID=2975976 RepID=UPI002E1A2E8D
MRRPNFLRLSAAGAASMGAAPLLGPWQAQADTIGPLRTAPATPFAVGVRQYNWTRGNRQVTTFVYYPSTGPSGSGPTTNAPVAPGVFPVCQYTHGSGASPQGALAHIRPMAAAGLIVPAPVFTKASVGDTYNGELPRDVSEAITRTLALNTGTDPLAGHIDTANIGVSGYSMGGMTTNALLTAFPDARIKAAVAMSSIRMGSPSPASEPNVLEVRAARAAGIPVVHPAQVPDRLADERQLVAVAGSHGDSPNTVTDRLGVPVGTVNSRARVPPERLAVVGIGNRSSNRICSARLGSLRLGAPWGSAKAGPSSRDGPTG